jgi:hypothetical protein
MRDLGGGPTDDNEWRVTARLRDPGKDRTPMQAISDFDVAQQAVPSVRVGSDGANTLFLYAVTREDAESAQDALQALLDRDGVAADFVTERWHPVAEDWEQADRPTPQTAGEWQAEFARRQPSRRPSGPGFSHRRES